MRSFAVTALAAGGLLGLAPLAQAATSSGQTPVPHPEPGQVRPEPAHARPAALPAQPEAPHARPEPVHGRWEAPRARADAARPALPHVRPEAPQARPALARPEAPHGRNPEAPHGRIPEAPHGRIEAPRAQPVPARREPEPPSPYQGRPAYILNMTGQATHWEVVPGELETVRWTLTNAGDRPLEHVQLVASIPPGWSVREGQGCEHRGTYLGCEVGSLAPGRSAAVVVPLIVQRPVGPVRLTAWSRAGAGRLTVPGPTTSFRVFVIAHH